MTDKNSSELDRLVEAAGPAEPALPGLLETPPSEASRADGDDGNLPAAARRGRPPGARNLRSERYAAMLRSELAADPRYAATGGDPLRAATRLAALDVLDEATIAGLAERWGCSRYEAAKLWATVNGEALKYHHQQLPRAVILPLGAPGGERVLMEIDGEFREVAAGADRDDDAEGC